MTRLSRVDAESVRQRADSRCEYCRVPQSAYRLRFSTDHIIARQHSGGESIDNLAFCCLECNLKKGPNIAGIDVMTGELTPLYHPRRDRWTEHFEPRGPRLIGRTAVGRVTVAVLDLNHRQRLMVRERLGREGSWP